MKTNAQYVSHTVRETVSNNNIEYQYTSMSVDHPSTNSMQHI